MNSIDQKFIEEKAVSFTNWFKGHLSLGREKIEERNFPMIQNKIEFYLTMSYGEGYGQGYRKGTNGESYTTNELIEIGRFKKSTHVNPNCKDATKCEPHGEVGEVVNND